MRGEAPDRRLVVSDEVDAVDVWLVDGGSPHLVLERLSALLDPGERLRADACVSDEDRREYVVAHAAVRCIVGERLGVAPTRIRWEIGAHGKPELRGGGEVPQVNLSHSGDLCMVAVTSARRVGVDIQRVEAALAAAGLARRFFPPGEARLVRDAGGAAGQTDLFARLWVRKEAVVKAAGSRLTQGLAVPIHGPAPMTVDLRADPAPGPYRVTDLEAPQGYRAAIALSGGDAFRVVRRPWNWPAALSEHEVTSPHGAVPS